MKKFLFTMLTLVSLTAAAQGKFDIQNFDGFTVHVYQPSDSQISGSLIVESRSGLVVLKPSQDEAFKDYLERFTKPVVQTPEANAPGTIQNWNGVEMAFQMSLYGASEADIIVGRSLYYVHNLPSKAHATLQDVSKPEDIDVQLHKVAVLLNSKCSRFVDIHGNVYDESLPRFLKKYYEAMKKVYKKSHDAEGFYDAMYYAFPDLKGEDALRQVALSLY